jgi:hypothetical protein
MVDVNREPRAGEAELFESEEYLIALGNFITRFSDLEGLLNAAVWKFANLKPSVHRAVLGRLAIEATTTKIKRLIRAKLITGETKSDIEYMLKQIDDIAGTRNDMLHLGYSAIRRGHYVFDNKPYALDKATAFSYRLSVRTLNDMSTDILRICRELYSMIIQTPSQQRMFWLVYDRVQGYAWRYKLDKRLTRGQPLRDKTRSRRARPRSSRR